MDGSSIQSHSFGNGVFQMENEIRVVVKNVYGTDKVYPYCMKARHFAEIAGTKTMTRDTLRLVQLLGYQVRVQPTVINMEI